MSDPCDESGYSKDDVLSASYLERPEFTALLDSTPAVADLDLDDYDAIVVCGGQAPMFNFDKATPLQEAFKAFVDGYMPRFVTGRASCST